MEARPGYSGDTGAWDRAGVHYSHVTHIDMDAAARELKRGASLALLHEWGEGLDWPDIPSFDGANRLKNLRRWLQTVVDASHLIALLRSDDGARTLLVRYPES